MTLPESHASEEKFDVLDITGGDGRWQRRILVYCFFLHVIPSLNMFSMSFLAPNIDHWCARTPEARNLSVKQWQMLAIPDEDPHCSRYKDINFTSMFFNETTSFGNDTISCNSWEYDHTIYSSTLLSQFNLVCSRKWLVSLSKSIYMIAAFTTIFIFSHLSDWFGRKPVIIVSGFIALCAGIMSAFSTSFVMFIVIRYFVGMGSAMLLNTPFLYMMEVVSPKYRNTYGLVVPLGFTLGMILLPLISWLLRDSFWIQITIALPSSIFLIAFWLPESPRWLLNHEKTEQAEKILIRAAEINKVEISDEHKNALKEIMNNRCKTYKPEAQKITVLDLFKKPALRMITLIVMSTWAVNSFVYQGISQNTNELAGDPFINFALYGFVEIPAYLLTMLAADKLGKRNLIGGNMVIAGMACFVAYLLPSDPLWLSIACALTGKLCITISFGLIFIYGTEIFPTVARNIGMGTSALCGRFASMMSPFMRELGDATHPIFPPIIYAVLSISSGLLIFLLPDTRNRSMPDTIEELDQFFEDKEDKKKNQNNL